MKDGLYIVECRQITAAFVVEGGKVTNCAPILRKNLYAWQKQATWYPLDKKVLDEIPGEAVEEFSDED